MIAGLVGDRHAGGVGELIACADNEIFETYTLAIRLLFRWGLSRSFSSFFSGLLNVRLRSQFFVNRRKQFSLLAWRMDLKVVSISAEVMLHQPFTKKLIRNIQWNLVLVFGYKGNRL